MKSTLHRLAFATVVAGALGFGATQAFAAPGAAPGKANSCVRSVCHSNCRAVCPTCYGYCDPDLGCVCEYI
jgi:hypothetical protein